MKNLYTYLKEEGEAAVATSGNTIGMGNPIVPGPDGEIGSEPIEPTAKAKRQKRKKRLKESLLDDEEDLAINNTSLIEQFLKDNYQINGKYEIIGDIVNIKGDIDFKGNNKTLTNGVFKFGIIDGEFSCFDNNTLETLEGSPEIIADFSFYHCYKLKSLKGAPKKVMGDLYIYDCGKIETLEGSPEEVGGDFICSYNKKLKSIKGLPKKIGGNFDFRFTPAYDIKENWDIVKKSKIKNIMTKENTKYI